MPLKHFIFCAVFLAASVAYGDGRDTALGEIIIYGTRLPVSLGQAGASVSVVTQEDIKLKGYDFVSDALSDVNGVSVNRNGSFGGLANVRVRGTGSNAHTLVLIDGVAVNDPTQDGSFDFATLDTAHIERIEILKGGQAALWGSEALSGVVSITTSRPKERELMAAFEAGSFQTTRTSASLSGAGGKTSWRLGVNHYESDGISKAAQSAGNQEKDSFRNSSLSARAEMAVSDNLRVAGSVFFADAKSEFDGFDFFTFAPTDGDAVTDKEQLVASVTADYAASEKVQHKMQIGLAEVKTDNYGRDAFASHFDGKRVHVRYQNIVQFDQARASTGVEYEESIAAQIGADDKYDIVGAFALYEMPVTQRVTLTAGARHDTHSIFGDALTGRAGLAYAVSDALQFSASAAQGRKTPSWFQLNNTPSLQPEKGVSFDAGFDWQSGRDWHLGLTFFRQDTKNLVTYTCVIFRPTGCYDNIDSTKAHGVELSSEWALGADFALAVGYTYTDAETGRGARLGRIPEDEAHVTLSYDGGQAFSGNVVVRYNGDELDTNGGAAVNESWWRVDANGAYRLGAGREIYFRAENLLDEDYQQVLGYGTAGASAYLGIRLKR